MTAEEQDILYAIKRLESFLVWMLRGKDFNGRGIGPIDMDSYVFIVSGGEVYIYQDETLMGTYYSNVGCLYHHFKDIHNETHIEYVTVALAKQFIHDLGQWNAMGQEKFKKFNSRIEIRKIL